MNRTKFEDSKPTLRPSGKCASLIVATIFIMALLTMALYVNLQGDSETNNKIITIVLRTFTNAHHRTDNTLIVNDSEIDRKVRAVAGATEVEGEAASNATKEGYYEEQRPVLVHAETMPLLAYRQSQFGPPTKTDSNEEIPFYADNTEEGYEEAGEESKEKDNSYDNDQPQENPNFDYSREVITDEDHYSPYQSEGDQPYGSDDGDPNYGQSYEQPSYSELPESRATKDREYDSFYRQWYYGTPAPTEGHRKLQSMGNAQNKNGEAYPSIEDERQSWNYQANQYKMRQGQPQQVRPQYRQPQTRYQQMSAQMTTSSDKLSSVAPSNGALAVQEPQPQQEHTLISVLKTLKTVWDIYQAVASAWNAVAEHRRQQEIKLKQLQEQQQQQQQQQQQKQGLRINSKKPAKIEGDKFNQQTSNNNSTTTEKSIKKPTKGTRTTKSPKTTTLKTTTTTSTTETAYIEVAEDEPAVVEPRNNNDAKGDRSKKMHSVSLREKRQSNAVADKDEKDTSETDVGEGRYIKGDPLKGYYDFVITEGSYKFWAAFQVGTAILIIYSTFAAIYYSKVNPLVSDYDYVDYLGGGRSLTGGDDDFVDDSDNQGESNAPRKVKAKHWFDWLPRTGHSLQFIMDAIDKLPIHEIKNSSEKKSLSDNDFNTTTESHDNFTAYEDIE